MLEKYKDILTINDICKILQIGKNSAYKLLKSNQIPNRLICNKYRVSKDKLIEYLNKF